LLKLNSQEPTALQELFSGFLQAKTHAIGLPRCGSRKDHLQTLRADASDAALRLARTTGLIVQEEAYLGRVLDPAEGSWFLESLTSELAEDAWDELRRLEAAGGIIAAIESGDLSRRIAEAAAARQDRVRAGRHPIIGVTEHPVEGEVATRSSQETAEAAMPSPFPFRPDAFSYESERDAGQAS